MDKPPRGPLGTEAPQNQAAGSQSEFLARLLDQVRANAQTHPLLRAPDRPILQSPPYSGRRYDLD